MVLATLWDCPAMVRSQRKWPWSPDHWTAPWKPRLLNFFPPQNENYLEAAMRESAPLVVVRSTHQHVCQAGLALCMWFVIHSVFGRFCWLWYLLFFCPILTCCYWQFQLKWKVDLPTPVPPSSTILRWQIFQWNFVVCSIYSITVSYFTS